MSKKMVFTFGRYNPPTVGHSELIHYAVKLAHRTGAEHRIYTSQSHDASKNPLAPREKMAFLRQIFPGVNFVDDPSMKTAFAICKKLADDGYEDVTFVVGDDRVNEFKTQLGKYVMPRTAKGFDPKKHYPFKNFKVVSSGARKQGISGTDLRAAVRKGDFATFAKASAAKDKTLARKIFNATRKQLSESLLEQKGISRQDFHDKLVSFVDYTCAHLGIDEKPTIKYKEDGKDGKQPSFAAYSPHSKEVMIYTKNRHPMDIFRSVAHELVHHKQNLDGRLGKNIAKEGATGSKIENEANSEAGKVMRYFGGDNPSYFDMEYVKEDKAIILAGTPGSGKDKILKEAILPLGFTEVSAENFHASKVQGNLVINGTSNYDKIAIIKEALDLHGYDSIMVFVNTSNEVSKQRNEARAGRGRVISENVRFNKWMIAQEDLNKYDALFEKVIEIKNDLDLNQTEKVIQETHNKLIEMVTKELEEFVLSDADRRFQNMLEGYSDFSPNGRQNPVGGAGNWGTDKLRDKYASDTPGQIPGPHQQMKVIDPRNPNPGPFGGDRIGDEIGMPKGPGFGDNQSLDTTGINGPRSKPVDRWMVKEETRRRFKERYGELAEQKLKETAARLAREGMEDPSGGYSAMVSSTGGPPEEVDNYSKIVYDKELEKKSIYNKMKKYKKTK